MCKYHGLQLYFYFAVYIAVAFLFALTSCCVSGRTGASLDHLTLISRRLKSVCQLARKKKTHRTEKTVHNEIRHFSVCFFCGMSVSKGLSCIVESWARIEIPNGVQKFSSYSNFNHGGTFSISNITTLH